MSIKLFSDFLVDQGKITREQLNEAVQFQAKNSVSLSKLAFDEGLLTRKELSLIFEKQKFFDQKFVDTVLNLTLLNTKQLDYLLKKYDQKSLTLYDILIDKDMISKEELDEEYVYFEKAQKVFSKHVYKEMSFFDRDNLIQDTITTLEKLYLRTLHEVIKLKKIDFTISHIENETIITQGLTGEEDIEYALVLEEQNSKEIINSVLKDPLYDEDENFIDTLSKFMNVFLVNMGASLISREICVELNELQVLHSNSFDLSSFYRLEFLTTKGSFSLYIKI